jgi:hypothetical protein
MLQFPVGFPKKQNANTNRTTLISEAGFDMLDEVVTFFFNVVRKYVS